MMEHALILFIICCLFVYLLYALFYPERF
ncbi:K(+)-transporting ATPase subunit F [Chthonomonas calidirosea]